jgi:GNAT superfamily N-acetyltransferase
VPGAALGSSPSPIAPTIRALGAVDIDRLALAPRTIAPFDAADARSLLAAALAGGARVVGAVAGDTIVGAAIAARSRVEPRSPVEPRVESLLALGVAPGWRRQGLGRALLQALVAGRAPGITLEAVLGVAERDVVEPLAVDARLAIGRRLLAGAGFAVRPAPPDVTRDDPWAIAGRLDPR